MPVVNCPDCREPVDIHADWYGRRIECPNCDRRFTPRDPDGRDRDDYDDPPPRRRRRPMYDDAPPKSSNSALWITLTVVGVMVVLPVLGCIGYFAWFANAKQQFAGTWTDHTAGPGGEVTASFPLPPTSHSLSAGGEVGGEQLWYSNRNANASLEAEFVAGYLEYPPGTPDPLSTQYPSIRVAVETEFMDELFGADVQSEKRTTAYGYPAMEATYEQDSGGYTLRVVHINDRPPGANVRVAVVLAGGMHLKPEDKQKFLNSVRIGKK